MELTQINKDLIRVILNRYLKDYPGISAHKAKEIYESGYVTLRKFHLENAIAEFTVKSQSIGTRIYGVRISDFNAANVSSSCSCPYDLSGLCKHEIACIYFLLDYINTENTLNEAISNPLSVVQKPDSYYTFPIRSIDKYELARITSWPEYKYAETVELKGEITETYSGNNHGEFLLELNHVKFQIKIQLLPDDQILMHCNCNDVNKKICVHKLAVLINIQSNYGNSGLYRLRNFDKEKELLLKEYGYTLKDDIKGKFDFTYEWGTFRLKVLDKSIQKIPGTEAFANKAEKITGHAFSIEEKVMQLSGLSIEVLIFCFEKNDPDYFPGCYFKFYAGKRKKNGELSKTFMELNVNQLGNTEAKDHADRVIIEAAKKMDAGFLLSGYQRPQWEEDKIRVDELGDDDYAALLETTGDSLKTIFEHGLKKDFYVSLKEQPNNYLLVDVNKPHHLSPHRITLQWQVSEADQHIIIEAVFAVDNTIQQPESFTKLSEWLYIKDQLIYKVAQLNDVLTLEKAENNFKLKYRSDDFETIFKQMIKPLSKKNKVVLVNRKEEIIEGLKPVVNVYLKEYDKYFLILPRFEYSFNEFREEAEIFTKHDLIFINDEKSFSLKRDLNFENEYTEFFKSLHPDFESNMHQDFFHLTFEKVMERGWFFELFDKLKQKEINVFGQNELRKIKYNPYRPVTKFRSSSGIDWFELKFEVSFGDEVVPLETLRKAMMNRQFFVPLSDGSIGMLPEEWVARYARLFKLGKVDKGDLLVSKMHFNLIDEFLAEINNEDILRELYEKKSKLLNFESVRTIEKPKNVKATLRHYQEDGFHWLNFLDEFGWGGCLADDMGLGKTLQVLTLLQHLKNENRLGTSLVVVPTTLIFNWKNEVEKFCKKLKLLIHRGVDREVNHDVFGKYDIVLTTYGTLRSDIADFKEFDFHYVILDESQAIKNVTSQISKAVRLLKAKNRLVMTGTPVENNTFDLYSQMEFLNPGFLGTQEYFRNEYATAIDKYGDETKAMELRKMIAPFVLKRTKEEVAKDLPEKTETILYCEMGKAQRKVYDAVKKKYREEIMAKMEEEGLNKSGFLILEGLLKLRMVCDSPVLIANDENDYGNESAKLEELIREISENAGHHKILVFSQFLKMLDLVRMQLEELNIAYQYLDGQTLDRKEKVDSFQEDETVRVFLISLKAGGVGINLTEADYVYLVDPWWNPAVERQAIDRTHRIGQKKNVFAYKMICKDSIEEKILHLQEKKKTLASNLIDTEKNILKKLNKDDIVELFG